MMQSLSAGTFFIYMGDDVAVPVFILNNGFLFCCFSVVVIFVSLCIVRFAILLSVMCYVQRCFLLLQVACLYTGSSLGFRLFSGLKIRLVLFFSVIFYFASWIWCVLMCMHA